MRVRGFFRKLAGFLALVLANAPAFAHAKDSCDFFLQCKLKDRKVSLAFESPHHNCANDDMVVSMTTLASRPTKPKPEAKKTKTKAKAAPVASSVNGKKVKLNVPPAWYYDVAHVGNEISPCRGEGESEYPAFDVGHSQLLVFLRLNKHPGLDAIEAVLLNADHAKVLDRKALGVTLRSSTGVLKTKDGYRLPVVKKELKDMRCDCDAVYVEGWLELKVAKGKISKTWVKEM